MPIRNVYCILLAVFDFRRFGELGRSDQTAKSPPVGKG